MKPYPRSMRRKARALRNEGLGDREIAKRMGIDKKTVRNWLGPDPRGRVGRGTIPVAALAKAFQESGLTPTALAIELGWYRTHGKVKNEPDCGRVKKTLGLKPYNPGKGRPRRCREKVDYETAERLCEAMGAMPYEVGL